jgi:flagellar export protein FliJ
MKPFRFALQRVLEFRATRVEAEEQKLTALQEELAGLERTVEQLEQSREQSARALATAGQVRGEELWALTHFCTRLDRERVELDQKSSDCARKLVWQQKRYTQARREHRLLEKLRERQLAEWKREAGREMEKVAGELYLARWKVDQPSGDSRGKRVKEQGND